MVPKLYRRFYEQRIFTLDEIRGDYPDPQQARNAVHYLIKNGYARKIKAGLYTVIPFEFRDKNYVPDGLLVGKLLAKDYFFSHATALYVLGVMPTYHPRVVVTSRQRFRRFNFEGIDYYCLVSKHFFGFKEHDYKGTQVQVSDQERTLIDVVNRFDLSGGIVGTFRNLYHLGFINYPKLMEYLETIGKRSLYVKVGFTIDYLQGHWEVDQEILKELQNIATAQDTIYYLDRSIPKGMGRLEKQWNLIIPNMFEELVKRT